MLHLTHAFGIVCNNTEDVENCVFQKYVWISIYGNVRPIQHSVGSVCVNATERLAVGQNERFRIRKKISEHSPRDRERVRTRDTTVERARPSSARRERKRDGRDDACVFPDGARTAPARTDDTSPGRCRPRFPV